MNNKLDEQLGRIQKTMREREAATAYQLPMWPDPVRGTPNAFLRSALFPAIQSKHRRTLQRELLAAQKGTTVRFTGIQLNQSDLDVWEQAVHLARQHPLGDECVFSAHSFLKGIGRRSGGSQHEQLKNVIARLTACAVEISQDGRTYGGSLVEEFYRDEHTERYKLKLNKKLIKLYEADSYSHVHWETRKKLRRKDLAQWLHGYYSTHKQPYPVKIDTLWTLCGSGTAKLKHFKANLQKALDTLVVIRFLTSFEIDEANIVRVERE